MFCMFWFWRCIAFILWSGMRRFSRNHLVDGSLLRHRRWRAHPWEERQLAAMPVAHAARREADWQRIDALLESLRDRSTSEDQAA
jgi:hypothetical protein